MTIERVLETPRVTKPYTEAQWQSVQAMGEQVDAELRQMDVRLTMGGEPTYVALGDRDAAEWNTDALGPTKRGYAISLMDKLRARYGVGGFLHFGQGKWYPGEQLPRWALSLYWRADGEPCWSDPGLFADEREPSNYTVADAERFIRHLGARLALDKKFIQPAYEDVWYYLWRERRLPINVDPFDSKLSDELERMRLRRVFTSGLDSVTGYVLPIAPSEASPALQGPRWVSGPWHLRDERIYLMPGDSPMGYRLPLDGLPWVSETDYPYLHEHDPFAPAAPLRSATQLRTQYRDSDHAQGTATGTGGVGVGGKTGAAGEGADAAAFGARRGHDGPGAAAALADITAQAAGRAPARGESARYITRTALCVEVRDPARAAGPKVESREFGKGKGVLYVFMPPLAEVEDYLELLAAIEATAAELRLRIVLEGYPPPRDIRLTMLQVTPDPGVIEVNIHPAASWAQLVDHTEFLYQSAHESYLSSEKFMVDGRHTGTGGGNHFVLGGKTPADSPFLRRPDLLASLIAFWHNHPSMSYLFSGLFIGPTSQAPRVDEARNDQLYELEIAFRELQHQLDLLGNRAGPVPPWLIDRSLRNILIDVTGNTHRSEFCIDKLYSPDGPNGRLGLLELRAFEMPPHARMSLVQQLLLRALIARFWQQPYTARLTRWGTELHDRFMLGSFVKMDFDDVLDELGEAGYPFDAAWFAPHFEFRFPVVGEIAIDAIALTIRTALEPWHVMGEEGAPGGTARYVDSSVERLEVHVLGLNGARHRITVNGETLPLQPTGRASEFVAGVRYKAWSPPSALHPTLPVHAPLVFDIVDTWNGRSIGGGQYHVAHPGGRSYDTFPVNAYEAESRRRARFLTIGHSSGPMKAGPARRSLEFPFTLDLRNP